MCDVACFRCNCSNRLGKINTAAFWEGSESKSRNRTALWKRFREWKTLWEQKTPFWKKPTKMLKKTSFPATENLGARGNLWCVQKVFQVQLGIEEKRRPVFHFMRKWPPFKRKTRPKEVRNLGWLIFNFLGNLQPPQCFLNVWWTSDFPAGIAFF